MNDARGYIEIEIGGEKRPMKFGWAFLAKLCKQFGVKLSEIQNITQGMDVEQVLYFIYFGLQEGARISNHPLPENFSIETVGDWLDTSDPSVMGKIFEGFASAMTALKAQRSQNSPG